MGNIFSNEEKLHRHKLIAGKNSHRIVGVYEPYGYNQLYFPVTRQREHRYIKRRNLSFQSRNGRNYYYKSKSHSLNAILEELYSFDPEIDNQEERAQYRGSKIPRIKLKRSTSSLKEEKSYKALRKMSSEAEIYFEDTTNLHKRENNDVGENIPQNTTTILINVENYDEMCKKSDDNYFTKNFDDCMKCLDLIEKEYKLIENADTDAPFCKLSQDRQNGETFQDMSRDTAADYNSENEVKSPENEPGKKKIGENCEINLESQSLERNENVDGGMIQNCITTETTKMESPSEDTQQEHKERISDWYSNLKQQFEKREQETQEKVKEMSCRITGATLKSQTENNKSEGREKPPRHYFSNLVKTNRSLIDEELPDPDKVKHIRAMFQETLNLTLKRKLDKKLGGSLQNISYRASEQQMIRPLSAQCCRNELFNETGSNHQMDGKKDIETSGKEVSKLLKNENRDFEIENTKKRLFEKYEKDLRSAREFKGRRALQSKWTDTGSVSSGVSSDLSSYDTDLESYSREGPEQDEITISDDDLLEEVKDKHYIQNEVLEKIRSYGTSVTYYGGEMITCSVGPLLSPTTQAIMEEIGEKYGHLSNPARSFDEFYRKYIETNEHSRKKKVGRTRSFGQNDVFQKPNVLSNTEIELYKDDLEIEIGIKKPVGNSQNSLRRKVTKSASLGDGATRTPKTRESQVVTITAETPDESKNQSENNALSEKLSDTLTEDVKSITNSISTPEYIEPVENNNVTTESDREATKYDTEIITSDTKLEKEDIKSEATSEELSTKSFDSPAKEIYFSYEKSIFNGKRNSDMEFEEFEVCESLSEKLEKLEKLEKQNSENTVGAIHENNDPQLEPSEETTGEQLNGNISGEETEPEKIKTVENPLPVEVKNETNQNEKKESKLNHSHLPGWPIETTVMVDIQRNDEQTPKIITNRKIVAKTKVRMF